MKTISSIILLFSLTLNVFAQTAEESTNSNQQEQVEQVDESNAEVQNTDNQIQENNQLNLSGMGAIFSIPVTFPNLTDSERSILENNLINIDGNTLMSHRGGNGGDTIASEFTTIANNAAIIWEEICKESYFELCDYLDDYNEMLNKESIDFVKVLSAPSVLANDNMPRDAVNFIDIQNNKNIIVAADRWEAIYQDYLNKFDKRILIVLHEYFSLIGLESSDFYPRSRELLTQIKNFGYDLSKIASNIALAENCTIHVQQDNSLEDSLHRDLITFLSEKEYISLQNVSQARYHMKTTLNCDTSGVLHHACSVYTEIIDTFKGREVIYDRLETEKAWLRKNKVIDIVFNKALSAINTCE